MGPLIKLLGSVGPRNFRLPITASVSDAITGSSWNLPSPRSAAALDLHAFLTTISLPLPSTSEDSFDWVVDNVPCSGFSSSSTWNFIRTKDEVKSWASSIWFKGATPRNAFNMWVSHLDRLSTRSRLQSWGMQVSPLCCLCSNFLETRDHLLLHCVFSRTIWSLVMSRLQLPPKVFDGWIDLINWTAFKNRSSPPILRKLVAQATVYAIWKQRNNILHNNSVIAPQIIFKSIDREIKNSINARRSRRKFRSLNGLLARLKGFY